MAKTVKSARTVIYRHTSHAEWGLGMIVEENPKKVYLAFEDGGRRPFLNAQRYRDQLVPAELEADAAEEIVAKISKGAAKATPKATGKKAKKAAAPAEEEAVEAVVEDEPDSEDTDDEPDDGSEDTE